MGWPHWIRHDWGPWKPRLYIYKSLAQRTVYTVERRACRICGKSQITTTSARRTT